MIKKHLNYLVGWQMDAVSNNYANDNTITVLMTLNYQTNVC